MKLPKPYADSSAFTEDILAFTETWLKFCQRALMPIGPIAPHVVLIAVTSSLTSEKIHSDIPNDIKFVSVKVSLFLLHVPIFHRALI